MKHTFRFLMLTVAAVLGLASCSEKDTPTPPVGPEADKYTFTDDMDESVAPGDDFYQYVIGSWLAKYPYSEYGWEGTMSQQYYQGYEWLESICCADSPDPIVADLIRRMATAYDDYEANVELLHAKTDRIAALNTRQAVLTEFGNLMRQGYKPFIYTGFGGNCEGLRIVFDNESFSDDDDLERLMESTDYSAEQVEQLLTLAADFFQDATDGNADAKLKVNNPRYWNNPENVLKTIPYPKSMAHARGRKAPEPTAADLLIEAIGVDPDDVLLADANVERRLAMIDEKAATPEGLEQLKAAMQLAVIKRDAIFILVNEEDELPVLLFYYTTALNYQLSRLYCEQNIKPEDFTYVRQMCEEFRNTFANRIERLDWMSEATKQNALKKLYAMRFYVGAPDQWDNRLELTIPPADCTLYEALVILSEQSNVLNCTLLPGSNNLNDIIAAFFTESAAWLANAWYSNGFNCISILASNLIPPICDTSMGDAYNYAVLGATTIGHELTHGFDTDGSKFNEKGIVSDWWTTEDKRAFAIKQAQLIKHVSAYEAVPGKHLNGVNTIEEDVADLGGLCTGLELLTQRCRNMGYSEQALKEQIRVYLLSFAQAWKTNDDEELISSIVDNDVHSPEKWRVNALVNNLDEWYSLFYVTEGQKLYVAPSERIHIW